MLVFRRLSQHAAHAALGASRGSHRAGEVLRAFGAALRCDWPGPRGCADRRLSKTEGGSSHLRRYPPQTSQGCPSLLGQNVSIRAVGVGSAKPLLELAAGAAFWDMNLATLKKVAGEVIGLQTNQYSSMFDLLLAMVMTVLAIEEAAAVGILKLRLVCPDPHHDDFARCDEALVLMEPADQHEGERQKEEHKVKAADRETFAKSLAKLVKKSTKRRRAGGETDAQALLRASLGGGRVSKGAFPKGTPSQTEVKALLPPGAYVWTGRLDHRWHMVLHPYPHRSRSWYPEGPRESARLLLQEIWSLWLRDHGLGDSDCPVAGIFCDDGNLPTGAGSSAD